MKRSQLYDNDIVAWLILGYLSAHPDAKDTAEGVGNWWLNGEGINVNPEVVRDSLEHLVKLGWVMATSRHAGITVYGLNQNRRHALQGFLESHLSAH